MMTVAAAAVVVEIAIRAIATATVVIVMAVMGVAERIDFIFTNQNSEYFINKRLEKSDVFTGGEA